MTTSNHKQVHSLADGELQHFYRERGFSGTVGFGDRSAILVIDLAKAWTDLSSPIGTDLSSVLKETIRILHIARRKYIPVFFTTMAYEPDLRDCGDVVLKKVPLQKMLVKGSEWVQIHPDLEMQPNEVLIVKQRASAFFGTSLLSQIIAKKIDTLIGINEKYDIPEKYDLMIDSEDLAPDESVKIICNFFSRQFIQLNSGT